MKDLLVVLLLGCLTFMTYVQEGDCGTLKQRTFAHAGGLMLNHARLRRVEGELSVGCKLDELRSCSAILSGGSGVFVSPTALLTAKHVVEGLVDDITVTTVDGFTFKSKEIIRDKNDDIALVIIDKPYGLFMQIDTRPLQLGDGLVCIGNPLNSKADKRLMVTFARVAHERHNNEFVYDGFCWHGYSGGPVIRNNKLVGITFARHYGGNYLGFATPVDRIDDEILRRFR